MGGDNGEAERRTEVSALHPKIQVQICEENGEKIFGPGPAELLRRVRDTGSLHSASKSMNMAYSKAMRIMRTAERNLGFSLLSGKAGGKAGGGSVLTKEGAAFLEKYEIWERQVRSCGMQYYRDIFGENAEEYDPAENGFKGTEQKQETSGENGDLSAVSIVVMASGYGRRFGSNKLLADLGGVTMAERTLDAVPVPMRKNTVVVTRYPEIAEMARSRQMRTVMNPFPDQSDTVRLGTKDCMEQSAGKCRGILFLPCDQPYIRPATLERLAMEFLRHPDDLTRLGKDGTVGSPMIFPESTFPALLAVTGDTGGREAARESGLPVHVVEAQFREELNDIDRPEDIDVSNQ